MQNKIIAFFVVVISLVVFYSNNLYSQDFEVEVLVNADALPIEAKDRLNELKRQVEEYYNKNKFAEGDVYPIKATIQFVFYGTDGFDQYNAQMIVASQRQIYNKDKNAIPNYTKAFMFFDERCTFTYNRSIPFIKNDVRFDSFLSLLDYYAYMMLGFDEDTYFVKGGNRYYQKAQEICNKPISDKKGWSETGGGTKPSRLQLAQEMLNPRFDDYRTALFEYYWMGLDSLALNPTNAYSYIITALEKMGKVRKKEVKAYNMDLFFDANYIELSELFLTYGDRSVYDILIRVDPNHQTKYEEAKSKAR